MDGGQDSAPTAECSNVVLHRHEPDGVPSLEGRFHYDTGGHPIRYEETRGDGERSYVSEHSYDPQGRLTRTEHDDDGDGDADRIFEWTYDGAGRVTTQQLRHPADPDHHDTTRFQWDARGWRLQEATDRASDGIVDEIAHYRYQGDPPWRVERSTDTDADGTPEYTYDYTFNDWHRIELIERSDSSGTRPIERFFYDAGGHLVRRELSLAGGDGLVSVDRHERDETGRRLRSSYDADGDGQVEMEVTFTWNDDGRLERRHYHAFDDQVLQGDFVFEWDQRGWFVSMNQISPDSPGVFRSWRAEYGCTQQRSIDSARSPVHDWADFAAEEDQDVDLWSFWWWRTEPSP